MAGNTAQGSGQLYDWGDGHGRVHTRPKRNQGGGSASVVGSGYGNGGQTGQQVGSGYGAGANQVPGVSGVSPGGQGPQPPAPLIQPPDPAYQSWLAGQQMNLGLSGANAAYDRGNLTYDSGYNAAGERDYTNPYNAAALLEENFKRSQLGTTNSYAGQGQIHSGAYGRQQNENARNYSIGSNSLQHQAATGYHGIDVGQAQNALQYGTGVPDQSLAALLRALGVGQ